MIKIAFIFCFLLASAYAHDLVRYYPLDGNGTYESNSTDLISGAPIQVIGASQTGGIFGSALYFDGVNDDKVEIVPGNYSNLTITLWLKPENLDSLDRKLFSFMSTRIKVSTTYIEWNADVHKPSAKVMFSLQNNTWYHLAITQQDTHYRMYVDGEQVSQGEQPFINTVSFRNFIGNYDGTKLYGGSIDEVGIWSGALDAAQVKAIYINGISLASQQGTVTRSGQENKSNSSNIITSNIESVHATKAARFWQRILQWLRSIF